MLFKLSILSCLTLMIVQMIWYPLNNQNIYLYGDGLFKSGILFCLSRLAKQKSFYYFIFLDFFFNLSIFDYIFRLFLTPYKIHINEYISQFDICLIILVLRLICNATKLNIILLIKKIFQRESE